MIPTALIIFREVLEISLILSLILAATRGLEGRGRWIWLGIAGGIAGSALVAIFAGQISEAVEGMGQEVFNGIILAFASLMIGWTVIWMKTHGKELAMRIRNVGERVRAGELPLYAIAAIVCITMLREGSEIVLFLYSLASASAHGYSAIVLGAALGLAAGAAIGLMLYFGLLTLSSKRLFTVTGWLLVLLAAGLAAQSAQYFAAAGFLPEFGQMWDSSAILSQDSLLGQIAHALLGYSDRPSGLQLIVYAAMLVVLIAAMRLTRLRREPKPV